MEAAHSCLQLLDVYLHNVVSFCLVNHFTKKRTQIVFRMALEVPIDACSKNSWEPPTQSPRRMAVTLPKPNFQGICLRKWMECNVGSFQHSQDLVSKCFTMSWMRQKCILFKGYLYPFTVANFAMPMAPRWDMQTLMTRRPFKGRKFDQGL